MSVFFYECFRLRERERSYLLGAVSEAKGMEKESFGVKKRESECLSVTYGTTTTVLV